MSLVSPDLYGPYTNMINEPACHIDQEIIVEDHGGGQSQLPKLCTTMPIEPTRSTSSVSTYK